MGSYTYGSLEVQFSDTLTDDELEQYENSLLTRCSQCHTADKDNYIDYDYEPEGWAIGDTSGDDRGYVDPMTDGFGVYVGGKVYDLERAVEHFMHILPERIMCEGEGVFETEGEHWGIRVKRREMQALNVELVIAPWKEEKLQTAVYEYLEKEEA